MLPLGMHHVYKMLGFKAFHPMTDHLCPPITKAPVNDWPVSWLFVGMDGQSWLVSYVRELKSEEESLPVRLHPVTTRHLYNILYNVGLTSKTLVRRCINFIQKLCAFWAKVVHKIWLFCIKTSSSKCLLFTSGVTVLPLQRWKYFCLSHGHQGFCSIWNHHKCLS